MGCPASRAFQGYLRARGAEARSGPTLMSEARYRAYLDCLNARRFEALDAFVAARVVHNGRAMSWRDYGAMIAGDVALIPDLRFVIADLLADDTRIAARLLFDCTPVGDFLGLPTAGRRIRFAEHVFYALDGGKITEVWSLLDRAAIAAQVAG